MRFLLILCFLFFIHSLSAQFNTRQLINAGGQSNSNSVLSAMWSVGQPAIVKNAIRIEGQEVLISQGFHKSENKISSTFELQIFPNPFCEFIYLNIEPFAENKFSFYLVDIHGKMFLENESIKNQYQFIDLYFLKPGIYFITIIPLNGISQTFSIIKT